MQLSLHCVLVQIDIYRITSIHINMTQLNQVTELKRKYLEDFFNECIEVDQSRFMTPVRTIYETFRVWRKSKGYPDIIGTKTISMFCKSKGHALGQHRLYDSPTMVRVVIGIRPHTDIIPTQ